MEYPPGDKGGGEGSAGHFPMPALPYERAEIPIAFKSDIGPIQGA